MTRSAPSASAGSAAALTRVSPADAAALNAALASATPGTMIELRADITYTAAGTPAALPHRRAQRHATSKIYLCGPRTAVLGSTIRPMPADDGGMSTNYGLWLSNSSHWVIDGFTVRTANKGVILDGSSNNTVRYLHVSDLGEEGIHVRRSQLEQRRRVQPDREHRQAGARLRRGHLRRHRRRQLGQGDGLG